MSEDFSCWNFGKKEFAITAWTETNPGYAKKTQLIIQDAMPINFVPSGVDGIFWFMIFRKRVQVLYDAQLLEEYLPWLNEMIRFAYIENYLLPEEYNYIPDIIYAYEKEKNFSRSV